jgi:hypothetical protein
VQSPLPNEAKSKGRHSFEISCIATQYFETELCQTLPPFIHARSTLKCCDCAHESVTFEPFWAISVPIPTATKSTATTGSYARSRLASSGEENASANIKLKDCLDLFVKGRQTITVITVE